MRIIVIGCTESTRRFIKSILGNENFQIVGIFTLEDINAHKKSRFTLLDDIAHDNGIRLFKLGRISDPKIIKMIRDLNPELILESGWSQIIPKEILEIPDKGCIGVHYSLLPKNQGAASLNWALIKDEKEWGVTLFYLQPRIDEGDIIDQRKFKIERRDNIKTLFDKADSLAVEMLEKNLPLLKEGKAPRTKQKKEESTYLPKRTPEDGKINWESSNADIFNLIRALTKPYPGAFTFYKNKKVFIWDAELDDSAALKPGEITQIKKHHGVVVSTGKGSILIRRMQFEDGIESWSDDLAIKYGIEEHERFS